MKSILLTLLRNMFPSAEKSRKTISEDNLSTVSNLLEKDGWAKFLMALFSTLTPLIFGLPKKDSSTYGLLKNRYKLNALGVLTMILFFATNIVQGQTALANTTAVTQNFDSMAATTTLPSNWRMAASTSSPTWSGASTTVTQQASSGSPATGGTYNFGSSSSERAVGAMTSGSFGSPNSLIGYYSNTNTANLISLTIAYDAERYRINSAAASIQFYYSTDGSSWTSVSAGDIATSSFPTGSSAYNFTSGTTVNKTGISITGLNIATNGAIYLRWNLNTTGSNSQGIAIDNISVTAGFASLTPTITGAATATAFTTTYGTPSASQTFSVSGSNLTANLVATAPTGFEVSSDGTNYNPTATFTQSGGNASGSLRIRLAATAAVTGTYNSKNIVLSSTGASSVNITTATSGNTVSAKSLTITGISGVNKVYDRTTTATLNGTAAYSGLVNSESFSVSGTPSASFANKTVANAKPITITGYAAPSTNYSLTQPSATANITAASLTIPDAAVTTKTYDGSTAATITGTLTGVISGDVVTFNSGTSAFANAGPGSGIAVTANCTLSGADSANYTLTQPTGLTGTINAVVNPTISVNPTSASAFTTTYGTPSTAQTFTVTGSSLTANITALANSNFEVSLDGTTYGNSVNYTQSGGTVSGNLYVRLSAAATSASYNNVAAVTLSSTGASDYVLNTPSTGNSVTAKALTITGLAGVNKVYDATTSASFTGTPIYSGLVNGETFSVAGTGTASFATKTVGTGKTVTITGFTAPSSNYTLSNPTVAADINAVGLTVTGATVVSKTYDGNTTANISGATLSGVISGDVVTLNGGGIYASANVNTGITVNTAFTLGGTDSVNYTLTQPILTGDITAKSLTITANDVTKYPAQVLTSGSGSSAFTSNGLVGSETVGSVTITYGAAGGATGFGNTVGVYPNQVVPSLATGGTFNSANYIITYVSGSITIAGFTKGNLVVNRLGDGTTSLGSIAAPISVLEYSLNGTLVNTINTGAFTGTNLLTDSGSGTSNGYLNSNDTFLAVSGYNSAVGTASVASLNTKATNIFGLGYTVAGRTLFPTDGTIYGANNFRSAVPTSATTFYASGTGSGTTGGIWYYNGSSFTKINTATGAVNNTRNVKIFNGNLYFSTGSGTPGIYQVGSGLPTTTGQSNTLLFATTSSPYGFAISPDGNTAYVADDNAINGNTGGGIQKWTKSGGTWTRQYTFGNQVRGLTVDFSGTNPIIYATTIETVNNRIIKITDTGSSATSADIASAGANYIFRGIDFAPAAASPTITASGTLANCNTTYGTSSAITSFSVSGTNMSSGITITPPAGFEVSTTNDFSSNIGTNASPILVGSNGTIANTTIYVRIPGTTNVGTHSGNITLTGSFANIVNIATVSSNVTAKSLTINGINGINKVYDGTTLASISGNAGYVGLANGEVFSVSGTPSASFADKNVGTAKIVTITGYTAPSANYTVTQPTITADITAKSLNVINISFASTKIFDGSYDAVVTASLSGIISGDVVTLGASAIYDTNTAGTDIPVTAAFTLGGAAASNYTLDIFTAASTANITPKELTITGASASNKLFDGNNIAVISGTLTGLVDGYDAYLFSAVPEENSYGTFASSAVGTWTVTPTWILSGDTSNYFLTVPTTTLTAQITSNATPFITSSLTSSYTYGDAVNYTIEATENPTSFNASNLPTGLTIDTATGVISGNPKAGTYTITISAINIGGTTNADLVLTVAKKELTVSNALAQNKVYDRTTSATIINSQLDGIVGSDNVTLSNNIGQFSSFAVGTDIFVTSLQTLSGTDANNYTLTVPNYLLANITAKPLTANATVTPKVYDGNNTATVSASLVGVIAPDTVTVSATGIYADVNAGNAISVIPTYTLNGADAVNYSISNTTINGNITKKTLTYTATANDKVYDGNTTATINVSGVTGIVGSDDVTITGTGTFDTAAIGNNKTVSATFTLSGTKAGNYSIATSASLTANITVAPTSLTAGDIAVIAYNTSGTPDNFAILILKDLTSGTQFFVNDNELATPASTSFTDLAEMEASFTVKPGQTIPAGTVIVLPWGAAAVSTTTYDWSSTSGAGLGASNDEIYIYTASSITATTPTLFLYFAKIGSSTSAIPASLETSTTGNGTTAISPSASALKYNTTTNIYNSCKRILLNEIGKTATTNWTTSGSAALAASDWTFTVLGSCPTPTITSTGSISALTTVYGSASINGTFNVSGTYLTDNIVLTAPTGFEISLNANNSFGNTITISPISGAVVSTPIYVRLLAGDLVGSYSGTISCSTTGGTTLNVAIPSSTVTPKAVTITGIFINNKVENLGDFSATISGTPTLNGVLAGDSANVSINSSAATAVFTQDNAGTNIPVTVSGYTLTGTASDNYALTQPTGLTANITTVASPTITSVLTFSSVYGTAIVSPYQITATSSNSAYPVTAYNATNLPAGLTFDSGTQTIIGTPTATPGDYTVTISATNVGGTTNAFLIYTITKKSLTVTASASNRVYNSTTSATITVSGINGVYGSDVVTIPLNGQAGNGTFDTKNVGTAKVVTSNLALDTTSATKYTLTQPTLTADITPFALTISGATAQNKVFDGNTNAVITATLVGVFSGDTVTFNGTGIFASAAIANNIAVTSTATLGGLDAGNYTFVQPTGLTASITDPIIYLNTFTGVSACPTNGNIPLMATNSTGTPVTRNTITCMSTGNVFNSTTLNVTSSVNTASYIEFSASANAGNVLNVKSLSFFRQASNSAPNQLEVRYSTDGFTTFTAMTGTPVSPTTGTVLTWDFPDFTTANAGTVTFRLYPYGTTRADLGTPAAASGTFRIDDVTIYGTVSAAPTNAALSLSGQASICTGTNSSIKVDISGGASPYTVVYKNQTTSETFTANAYVSGSPISVAPATSGNNIYTLLSVTDNNGLAIDTVSGTATISVIPNNTISLTSASGNNSQTVCNGMPITTITYATTGATGATFSGLPVGVSGVWSSNTVTISGNPTSVGGTYTINLTGGCGTITASGTITATSQLQWYLDADGDHYYTGSAVSSCTSPGTGYTTTGLLGGGDCNDTNNTIYPGAVEICYNNILENCSGTLSQGCAPVVVNMTPSYNNTTLPSLSTAIPAVAYTYASYTNLKYRFRITNVTTNTTAADIIQTSRYVTIPASIHSYNAQYTITVSAIINDEVVAFAGNTITLNSPTVQLVTLNSATCGATLAALTSTLTANPGLNATGYTFRIRVNDANPSPTYAYSQSSTRFISANSFTGFPLQYSTSYKVAVQFTFNDPVTNLPVQSGYGSECTVNTPSIPVTTMASPTCGSQVTAMNANISATAASYATGYQFRIRLFADNSATPAYNTSVANASRFSSLTAFTGQGPLTLAYNTEYAVSVRYSILNGSTTVWSDWGPDCKVKTPFFPVTSLVPSQCGLTTATSLTQQLNITPYPGFPNYRVKLDEVSGEDIVNSQEIVVTYPYFRLNQFSIAQEGKNYNVSVAIKLNGEFGPYDTACDLFTSSNGNGNNEGGSIVKTIMPFKATAYPNPFANNFMLDVKSSSQSNVSIKVYDMIGRMIEQKEVRVSDMETTTIGDQYPSGVYNVVVSQEDSVETVRVVKR